MRRRRTSRNDQGRSLPPASGEAAGWPSRPTVMIGLLALLILVSCGYLAWQAAASAGSHQATAESVVRDYAALAANEFSNRVGQGLGYEGISPAWTIITECMHAPGRLVLPGRAAWDPEKAPGHEQLHETVRCLFHLNRDTGELTLGEDGFDASERRWLQRQLEWHADEHVGDGRDLRVFIATRDGRHRMLVYGQKERSPGVGRVLFGFEVREEGLQRIFAEALERGPLLPEPLVSRKGGRLVAVTVYRPDGSIAYRTPAGEGSTISSRTRPEPWLGDLVVEASLSRDSAADLVIGGLPTSRLPTILAVLGITVLLVGATWFILRREQQLVRLRSDFVAGVSHELRTPLAQIRLFSEMLLLGRARSPAEQRRAVEIIDQEARRLTHQVENVLQFSRAEGQGLKLQLRRLPLGPLVAGVIEAFKPLAASHRVTIRSSLDDVPDVLVDKDAFRRILLNLLDNAVKYGPRGQTVNVALRSGNDRVMLLVEDEGPGVSPRDRERIWSKYWRAPGAAGEVTAGTGIGLYLVKELVTLHDGRVWVANRKSGGASFVVTLPVAPGAPSAPPPATTSRTTGGAEGT